MQAMKQGWSFEQGLKQNVRHVSWWGGGHTTGFHFGKANAVAASAVSVVGSNLGLAEVVGNAAVELYQISFCCKCKWRVAVPKSTRLPFWSSSADYSRNYSGFSGFATEKIIWWLISSTIELTPLTRATFS